MARAVLAMTGSGKSSPEHAGMALVAPIRENRGMGRDGNMGMLTANENGGEEEWGRRVTARGKQRSSGRSDKGG
jgi:hypothetical protein